MKHKRYWKAQSILGYDAPLLLTIAPTQEEAHRKMLLHLRSEVAARSFVEHATLQSNPEEITQATYHQIKRLTQRVARRLEIPEKEWLSQLAPDTFSTIAEG